MEKFKIGDKVIKIKDSGYHSINEINDIGIITQISHTKEFYRLTVSNKRDSGNFESIDDIQLITADGFIESNKETINQNYPIF